ncbi:MAG TPA: transposase family protein [Arthrobacter sp.]
MGRRGAGFRGDRSGRPRRVQQFRPVLLHTHGHGYRDRLDREPVCAEQGSEARLRGLQHILAVFPFPVIGIDSDNGSEFINNELFEFCIQHRITFTRSRPGNKNDDAHVEQKNWSWVRELVGYLRYDTAAELELLNEIWEVGRIFTNYLLPSKTHRQGPPRSQSEQNP